MVAKKRTDRLNALLQQVLADVIRDEVKNPHLPRFVSIMSVDITNDLHHAKVFISVIGDAAARQKAVDVLNEAAGFIAQKASKLVVMRFFPQLTFHMDDSVDKHCRIGELLAKIEEERGKRPAPNECQSRCDDEQ